MILTETFELLKTKYREHIETITISRVNIGVFFAIVELSNGYCGIAAVDNSILNCCNHHRKKDPGPFSSGKIHGQKLIDLINFDEGSAKLNFVKLAAINAISAEFIDKSDYKIIEDKDPIELVELSLGKTICVVGAFHSYIKKINGSSSKLVILEINKGAVPPEFHKQFVHFNYASSVLPKSDVIIITGSTLINNTIDNVLALIPPSKQVIIVGPTAGIIPDILFYRGVSIIGSAKVVDPDKLFDAIAEGASGYELFHNGAKKICILNETK
jgi:uncharacterized protein (DUF4213/DUF364 family)